MLFRSLPLAAAPVVSNVRASQRGDGSGLVDVYYDLSGVADIVRVSAVFSSDNGATWNVFPGPGRAYGAYGTGVRAGANRHIVWDAPADRPNVYWGAVRAKVIAHPYALETVVLTLPGTATIEMVRIPAGSFQMGSNDPGWSNSDELPVHPVTIGYDFWMSKTEVTQGQWTSLMGTNPSSGYGVGDAYPVYNVSWNDICVGDSFLSRLSAHLLSTGQAGGAMRLPSEAEWEYACRAGSTTRFGFGNDEGWLPSYAVFGSGSGTQPVGMKLPNAFGLHDMHGNVFEWCSDWYHSSYTGAPADGSTWSIPVGSTRVLRGGAWNNPATSCRSASRNSYNPAYGHSYIGFRLSRTQ